MTNPYINSILAITSLTFNTAVQAMSEDELKSADKHIDATYRAAKADCCSFTNNAKAICMAVVKKNATVAKAELNSRYQLNRSPT